MSTVLFIFLKKVQNYKIGYYLKNKVFFLRELRTCNLKINKRGLINILVLLASSKIPKMMACVNAGYPRFFQGNSLINIRFLLI